MELTRRRPELGAPRPGSALLRWLRCQYGRMLGSAWRWTADLGARNCPRAWRPPSYTPLSPCLPPRPHPPARPPSRLRPPLPRRGGSSCVASSPPYPPPGSGPFSSPDTRLPLPRRALRPPPCPLPLSDATAPSRCPAAFSYFGAPAPPHLTGQVCAPVAGQFLPRSRPPAPPAPSAPPRQEKKLLKLWAKPASGGFLPRLLGKTLTWLPPLPLLTAKFQASAPTQPSPLCSSGDPDHWLPATAGYPDAAADPDPPRCSALSPGARRGSRSALRPLGPAGAW